MADRKMQGGGESDLVMLLLQLFFCPYFLARSLLLSSRSGPHNAPYEPHPVRLVPGSDHDSIGRAPNLALVVRELGFDHWDPGIFTFPASGLLKTERRRRFPPVQAANRHGGEGRGARIA
jgi:hypothetical protein